MRAQERKPKRERAQERQIGGINREIKRERSRERSRERALREVLQRELKSDLNKAYLKGIP